MLILYHHIYKNQFSLINNFNMFLYNNAEGDRVRKQNLLEWMNVTRVAAGQLQSYNSCLGVFRIFVYLLTYLCTIKYAN